MMIEDYYGFCSLGVKKAGFESERSVHRTERSPKIGSRQLKSLGAKTLKRTELSNQKLHSKESNRKKFPPFKHQNLSQMPRQEHLSKAINPVVQNQHSSSKQQLKIMAKKYHNYIRTDSGQLTNGKINNINGSLLGNSPKFKSQFRELPRLNNLNQDKTAYQQREYSNEIYNRYYHSASRGKENAFLLHFQRSLPINEVTDRTNQNMSSRSNNPRSIKSKSLSNSIKKKYSMHTFYHADKHAFCDYNEQGYVTERQEQLLYRTQENARRAFQKAAQEWQNEKKQVRPKRSTQTRKFEVEESSRIKHNNSDILSDLKQLHENSRYNPVPVITKHVSDKYEKPQREEQVINVSIDPKKSKRIYNDYQMKQVQRQMISNPSISNFIEGRQQNQSVKENNQKVSQDDSLLQFKPAKKKAEEKQPPKEIRSSELQNYKSVDMMQINSNCKINEKQVKEKVEHNFDDNGQLGINTIQSFQDSNRKSEKIKQSNLSQSISHSLTQSDAISYVESHSSRYEKVSHKLSSESNVQKIRASNFSKHSSKSKHSQSVVSQMIYIEDMDKFKKNSSVNRQVEQAMFQKQEQRLAQQNERLISNQRESELWETSELQKTGHIQRLHF